ncbi:Myb-like DNA-binding protein [Melghirimyces profundicolus]|uniref:Myb-like DNA-binding protein n=1 Tax=Melghirimyces profundicolus TaxID=1242148 RepID=A0A2T6BGK3_9BACL|nr:Myb-like DNA-binding domain-containing protein [Melghirimyces profundicolus]PTX55171.1 Myb-like DNA-binding protein [Melghirimyces profundicolus]
MSRSWSPEEDRMLLRWVTQCRQLGMSRADTFASVADRLDRSESVCFSRWKVLSKEAAKAQARQPNSSTLQERIRRLEEKLEANQNEMKKLMEENRKTREEMRFFEIMLLEEYRILISLLDKKNPKPRLHRL